MIHYRLVCEHDHDFEGWFRNGEAFEAQVAAGQVTCPICHSAKVSRGLMAPAVQAARKKEARADAQARQARQAMVAPDPRQKALLEAMREIRRKVTAEADYVGDDFANEARRIQSGEAEERGIWGEATLDEAQALGEEGIDIFPLPLLPEEQN